MAVPLTSVEPLLPVIRQRPLGLMSDIDGTQSPIVSRPEEATVPEATRSLLHQLVAQGVKVGLLTGRSLETARRMAGLDDVAYAAEHGLILCLNGRRESAPGLEEYEALAREAERDISAVCEAISGVQMENKGALLAVHYRRAGDPTAARKAVLAAVERSRAAGRFRTQEGRMVIELRPPLEIDKGTALETLAERLGLRGVVCLGDDITDIDMFAAARRLRAGGMAVATVAVVGDEAAPEVAEAADYAVEGVAGVSRLLREMVRALP
ncbi:MAG: trehalose-phosphatase [Dehalococcoidia bacterium]